MAKVRTARSDEVQQVYELMKKLLAVCDDSGKRPEISLTALSMAFYVACTAMDIQEKDAIDLARTFWEHGDTPKMLH